MSIIGKSGTVILMDRVRELEARVAELQENFAALRQVLEVIRDAVMERAKDE